MERLDFEGRKAFVRAIDCDYYTDAITYTRVTILDTFAEKGRIFCDREATTPFVRSHGEVQVVSRVVGFKKIKFYTNENVGSGELDLPEQQMHTTSYWLTIPAAMMGVLPYASDDRRDGVVGLAFAMRQVAQLLLMCDRHDIGISIDSDESEVDSDRRIRQRRSRSEDLHLRQLSGRHRIQRAAVSDAPRAARRHAEADRGVRVRERLPGMRRPGRQHRTAGEDGGAWHPRSAARRGRWRPDMDSSKLADRLRAIVRDRIRLSRIRVAGCKPDATACRRRRRATIAGRRIRRQPDRTGRVEQVLGGEWLPARRAVLLRRRTATPILRPRYGRDRLAIDRRAARRRVGGGAARHGRRPGASAVRLLRSGDDRLERRRRHVRVSRGLRRVRRRRRRS